MITIKKEIGQGGKFLNNDLEDILRASASFATLDVVIAPTPASLNNSAAAINTAIGGAAAKFTQDVTLTLKDADGNVLTGFNGSVGPVSVVTLAETSGSGVFVFDPATILAVNGSDKPIFVKGVATLKLDYTGTWSGGTLQIETITCTAGESTGAGNITMTITAAGMSNSPKAVVVPVVLADGVNQVGLALRTALAADPDVSAYFTVSGADASAILTKIAPAVANDATLAFGFVDTDSTGVTFGASTDTAAGVVTDTATLTITEAAMAEANGGDTQTVVDTLLP